MGEKSSRERKRSKITKGRTDAGKELWKKTGKKTTMKTELKNADMLDWMDAKAR